MIKNVLKFAVLALLLICLVAVPVFGASFYDIPSIFSENAFYTNRQFGSGTSAFLRFVETEDTHDEEEEDHVHEKLVITDEDLENTATILAERFKAVGFGDIVTEKAADNQVRVDVAQTSFIENMMSQLANKGEWSFVGSTQNAVCDASMVEDAYVSAANGAYYVTLKFTEEGAEQFKNNCSSIAASSGSIYLMVDGAFTSYVNLSNVSFGNTFSFGTFAYSSAAQIAATIKHGALPAAMEVASTEPLPPTVPGAVITGIIAAFAVAFVALAVVMILKGKTVGVFSAAALLADVCVILTYLACAQTADFRLPPVQLNIATVITLFLCLIFAGVFSIYAVTPFGAAAKEGKSVSGVISGAMKKINKQAIWIHAAIFVVTVICWLFARGTFLYIVLSIMMSALINLTFYFIFTYFGARTLGDATNKK